MVAVDQVDPVVQAELLQHREQAVHWAAVEVAVQMDLVEQEEVVVPVELVLLELAV
jgi:hypothetical protein